MRSTIYMNDYPHFSSPIGGEAVTVDLTASVAELANYRSAGLGKAVDLAFRTLGIERMSRPPYPSDMLVISSTETISERLPELRKAIGSIARGSADIASGVEANYHTIGYILDNVAQQTIPQALESTRGVIQVVGNTLSEFGETCNDDGCGVEFGKRAGWYAQEGDDTRRLRTLPFYAARNVAELDLLEPHRTQDRSYNAKILRARARKHLLDEMEEAPKLKKGSRALRSFEQRLFRDAVALERIKNHFAEQPGKGFDNFILPEDVIHQLIDDELRVIEREAT